MIGIAGDVGHFWETIWNDPANSDLKEKRGSPHVLLPGDRLHIPPIRLKQAPAATGQLHRFKRKGVPIRFELAVMEDGEPLAGCRYTLTLDGDIQEGTIPNDGVVSHPIKPGIREGELRVFVESAERVYPLLFGHLDPSHTRPGAMARLENMGYLAPSEDDELFRIALTQFQKDHSLSESGDLDHATASKLAEVHGS